MRCFWGRLGEGGLLSQAEAEGASSESAGEQCVISVQFQPEPIFYSSVEHIVNPVGWMEDGSHACGFPRGPGDLCGSGGKPFPLQGCSVSALALRLLRSLMSVSAAHGLRSWFLSLGPSGPPL